MSARPPLSQSEFTDIFSKVPRLTVEIILTSADGVFLTERNIDPCRGLWHLPGGTVRFGERLTEAVARIAARELGIEVGATKQIGYIEYPSHFDQGLDSPVGIAFAVTEYTGQPVSNHEAKNSGWYKSLPAKMHDEQRDFLLRNKLITAA